jgi:hypothetical protein
MEEGLVVPSLTLQTTKRVIEVATLDECNEIEQCAVKRRHTLSGAALRGALHAIEALAPFADIIDTVSVATTTNHGGVMSFDIVGEQYHFSPGSRAFTSYIRKCVPKCVENNHFGTGSTAIDKNYTMIAKPDRPTDTVHVGRFIDWIEALVPHLDVVRTHVLKLAPQ